MSVVEPSAAGLYGSVANETEQRDQFTGGDVPVAVYGLGKMGLPLAAVYAQVTGNTTGVDVDPDVVAAVARGHTPIKREPGLADLVSETVDDGSLDATTDGEWAAEQAAVHVIMVPTLLTEEKTPDLSMVDEVVKTIGRGLSPGDLVFVESTVPPRTTVDRVVPKLRTVSGLRPDTFGAAACPERTVSGQALKDIGGTHPKVVGGIDSESTRAARLVYSEITDSDVIPTPDATTAEAVKVFEGIYRDLNIALANQLAKFTQELEIDATDAIEVANTQPFCDIHDPGPGVGGHCIPVYPYFLSGQYTADASLLEAARACNDSMPAFTVRKLQAILTHHEIPLATARVLLLGVTYKANVAELRNAPAIPISRLLREQGSTIYAVDPLVDDWSALEAMDPISLAESFDQPVDAVLLVTPHDEFETLDWDRYEAPILDGRQAIDTEEVTEPVYTVGGRWP